MRIEIIQDEETFLNFQTLWNELNNEISGYVFQSFEWNYFWWKSVQDTVSLYIIMVYENNTTKLEALFPFVVDKKKVLRFMADIHSDYSNFLIKNEDTVWLTTLFKKIASLIQEDEIINSVELKNIRQDNVYISYLVNIFDFKQLMHQTNAYSQMEINTSQPFLQSIPYIKSKHRSELKRIYKRYDNLFGYFYGNEQSFPEKTIRAIVTSMIESGIRDPQFMNDTMINVVRELFLSGQLLINETSNDKKEVVAMNFILHRQGEYLFWIDIYKNFQMINIYSYVSFLEILCSKYENSSLIVDFGRGLYAYKVSNFFPKLYMQYTFFYAKKNSLYTKYLAKVFMKLSIKNFYKKHKDTINKLLRRT